MSLVVAGLAALAVFAGVHWCYVIAMSAKKAYREARLTRYWIGILSIPLVGGVLLDFVFNYTFGLMFLAVPRPVMFSGTVQWHYRHSKGWRKKLSDFWAKNLNVFDDHIKP